MLSCENKVKMTDVNVAKDYTKYPGGRYRKHGKGSGQEFREVYLEPSLSQDKSVTVFLDGVAGYPASFLEEAFGGLVRKGFKIERLQDLLKIKAKDPLYKTYADKAWQYISDEASKDRS